jgi:hypothetical protein
VWAQKCYWKGIIKVLTVITAVMVKQATAIISPNIAIKEWQTIALKQGFAALIGQSRRLERPTFEQH